MTSTPENLSNRPDSGGDPLGDALEKLGLRARLFLRADFCGRWGVDASGARRATFHFIEKGEAFLHLPGQAAIALKGGDFIVFPNDSPHCISNGTAATPPDIVNKIPDMISGDVTSLLCGYLEFENRCAWPLLESMPQVLVLSARERDADGALDAIVRIMIYEAENAAPGMNAAINRLSALLFIHLLRSQMKSGASGGMLAAFADRQIGRALSLIQNEYAADWTVDRLANEVGMSRSAFAEKFSSLVGRSPMRYLAEWRMHEALERFRSSEISVAAAGLEVGYQSEVVFRKAFRKLMGMTPGAARAAKGNET